MHNDNERFRLIIGDRQFSTCSLRGWLAARRARYGADGAYLFGTLADAFFAPVVSRFRTYGLDAMPDSAARYAESVWRHADVEAWMAAAGAASRA